MRPNVSRPRREKKQDQFDQIGTPLFEMKLLLSHKTKGSRIPST